MSGWKELGFETYQEFLQSYIWEEKRKVIIMRRGNFCEKCNSKESLQVHHLNYNNVGNESKNDVIVLCKKCHEEEHGKQN